MNKVVLLVLLVIVVCLSKNLLTEKFSFTQYGIPTSRERLLREYNLEGFTEEDYDKFRSFYWKRRNLLQKNSAEDLEGTELGPYEGTPPSIQEEFSNVGEEVHHKFDSFAWKRRGLMANKGKYYGDKVSEGFRNFGDRTDNNFKKFNWERWNKKKKGWFAKNEPEVYDYEDKPFAD